MKRTRSRKVVKCQCIVAVLLCCMVCMYEQNSNTTLRATQAWNITVNVN